MTSQLQRVSYSEQSQAGHSWYPECKVWTGTISKGINSGVLLTLPSSKVRHATRNAILHEVGENRLCKLSRIQPITHAHSLSPKNTGHTLVLLLPGLHSFYDCQQLFCGPVEMGRLEVACFSGESALRAAAAGVHRIELCSDRASGGITPALALLKDLRSRIPSSVPINVMVRPRPGNFHYSDVELEEMVSTMEAMKPCCNGFVFGVLKADSSVDVEACTRLVRLAQPLPCTFHRAFDEASARSEAGEDAVLKALDNVLLCGFKTILTSGGPGNAIDNMDTLRKLVCATVPKPLPMSISRALEIVREPAFRHGVVVMAGGGLRSKDIATLQSHNVQPAWYHTSAILDNGDILDENELIACKLEAEKGLLR
jgi:copper homeostasis protein